MHLSHLSLRNYRGIRRLELPLDETTVLLGENSLGKSNLLDALAFVLAPEHGSRLPRLSADDLHVPADGDQRAEALLIALTFDEPTAGAWDGVLDPTLLTRAVAWRDDRRRLLLEVHGTAADTRPASTWFFVDGDGRPLVDESPGSELLAALRRAAPFVLLDGAPYDPRRPVPDGGADGPPSTPRQRLIGDLYRRLTSYSGPPEPAEIEAAIAAVRDDLLARAPSRDGARPALDAPWRFATGAGTDPRESHPSSATATVAAWLLVGGLLDHLGTRRPPWPIVAIEDAEAHLHPVLLASVWRMLVTIPAQKLITTNAAELAGAAPLESLRRLTRMAEGVVVRRVPQGLLDSDDRRRIAYHLRVRRGGALFARAWLLVEGETEFWLLPELARLLGYDLSAEGVAVVEFAQCGVDPLVAVASSLAIPWHLLVDGDGSGHGYAAAARRLGHADPLPTDGEHDRRHADAQQREHDREHDDTPAHSNGDAREPAHDRVHDDDGQQPPGRGGSRRRRQREPITVLPAADVEHALWQAGYAGVYRQHAPAPPRRGRRERRPAPGHVISLAVRATSKPFLALAVAEAAARPGSPGVPDALARALHDVVARARAAASAPACPPAHHSEPSS